MKNFDEKLLRLKQAAKLTADQDVAALLGMTKAAFSERKKRDAFPDEKLFALIARRPELKLNAAEILMGPDRVEAMKLGTNEIHDALLFTANLGGSVQEQLARATALVELKHSPLTPDEQLLLDSYRLASKPVKARLLTAAVSSIKDVDELIHRNTTAPLVRKVIGQNVEGDVTNNAPQYFGVSPPKTKKTSKQ